MRCAILKLFALVVLLAVTLCTLQFEAPAASTTEAPSTPVPPLLIFARAGNQAESMVKPHGPGLVLMGGGSTVDPALEWMHDTIVGSHGARGGDIIVLTAHSGNIWTPYIMKVAPFNSVRTISIGPSATAADLERAARYIGRAQGVFFSGGDQAHYVKWKGSSLIAAVQRLYDRGGVVGGSSAGLAILGDYVFDSVAADKAIPEADVTTPDAVANPTESTISFTHGLFTFAPLHHTITDTHFVQRNRLGRLVAFLARLQLETPDQVMGVALNAGSALVVDRNGIGTLMLAHHRGEAMLVRLTQKTPIAPGRPLEAKHVRITLLNHDGQHIDFNTWCAEARTYFVDVNGAAAPYYSPPNPYAAPSNASIPKCSHSLN